MICISMEIPKGLSIHTDIYIYMRIHIYIYMRHYGAIRISLRREDLFLKQETMVEICPEPDGSSNSDPL